MTQNTNARPRVAAIGLDESQIESIEPLCGSLRIENSLREYLQKYSWSETDITILGEDAHLNPVTVSGNVLIIKPWSVFCTQIGHSRHTDSPSLRRQGNTEREMRVPEACPEGYGDLAEELVRRLGRAEDPPSTVASRNFPKERVTALVETTSGRAVALRCIFTNNAESSEGGEAIALALPREISLFAWFRAFLADIHELNPAQVPQAPPRLGNPSNWYTPEERVLAERIVEIADKVDQLKAEQKSIQVKLASVSEEANAGIRRCVWADGDDLVASIGDVLEKLGFIVRHMDTEQKQGEPKREDLRLTLANRPGWEAIAEVKGYTKGTRTNDARQIREHRDHYTIEKRSPPNLTLWIANTHRAMDPSSRPAPDSNVGDTATNIGAVHVLATDLYRLWTFVAADRLKKAQAVQLLISADPGLWSLPVPDAD